jgi:hypothetical protein
MMNSDTRTVIILAVIFIALVGAFLFQTTRLQEETAQTISQNPTPEASLVFPSISESQIRAIQLRDPASGNAFTMSRGPEGDWRGGTVSELIDQTGASYIARTLVLLPYYRRFEAETDNLSRYGFDSDGGEFVISFITTDGEQHSVVIGGDAVTGSIPGFYGLVDDRPEMYVLEASSISFLLAEYLNPPLLETAGSP